MKEFNKRQYSKLYRTSVKEDAMGGVSAPFATLNNTPGMGNGIPANPATNWIGSGDSWGNVLNGKPYTQTAGISKKKRKKKKKITEENTNPYDKLGSSISKKLKVDEPFKAIKSKNNQNSMKQKRYIKEYEEIENDYSFEDEPYKKNIKGKITQDEFTKRTKGAPLRITREKIQSLLILLSDMDKHIIKMTREGKPRVITNMEEWVTTHGCDPHDALTAMLYKLKFNKTTSHKVRSNVNTRFHTAGVWEEKPYPKGVSDNIQLLLYAIMKNSRQNWGKSFDSSSFNIKEALSNDKLLLLFYVILDIASNTKGVPFLSKYAHNLNIARAHLNIDDIDLSKL